MKHRSEQMVTSITLMLQRVGEIVTPTKIARERARAIALIIDRRLRQRSMSKSRAATIISMDKERIPGLFVRAREGMRFELRPRREIARELTPTHGKRGKMINRPN